MKWCSLIIQQCFVIKNWLILKKNYTIIEMQNISYQNEVALNSYQMQAAKSRYIFLILVLHESRCSCLPIFSTFE
uniref:Uncharacterized protein n=1 Tax=Pararge aegeria TaxID=116150 RepID=S4NYY3_9NEOP